ncbi:hypothetical protein AB0B30_32040 [Streptomyces narbonensis]|uniref:Uncharacterized protein n=1 Tax=Streptomyces narbonensis TaxID=67333 RepID=A0ABV3CGX0_9ACTN
MTGRVRNPRSVAAAAGAVLGAVGAATAALAGAALWAVPLIGLTIAVLTWGTHTAANHLDGASTPTRAREPGEPWSPGGIVPSAERPLGGHRPLPTDTLPWLTRASAASAKLDRHRREAPDPTLAQALDNASENIRSAVDQLHARATAVGVIDATTADTDREALRRDEHRLKKEATAAGPGPVREAKLASARAVAERRDSLTRLTDLRDHMTATLETTALHLEAAAERGSMLVALRAADEADTRPLDLTALGDELEAVQAGLDRLDEITRLLHDEGTTQ